MRNAAIDPDTVLRFRCNICGQQNEEVAGRFHRELAPCATCGANVRFRGIVHALTEGLYGASRVLRELPPDEPTTGLGFSDDRCYASLLESRFAYLNTELDAAPVLDITKDDDVARYMQADFVICSDVLEHVAPPVDRAFRNLAALLRPGGLLVFSVPSFDMPETVEHYPRFHDASIVELGGEKVLLNRTAEGELETFRNLVFHGGAGSTLEMRLFAESDVVTRLKNAGFHRIRALDTPVLPIGYYWLQAPGEARGGFEPRGYVLSARRMD